MNLKPLNTDSFSSFNWSLENGYKNFIIRNHPIQSQYNIFYHYYDYNIEFEYLDTEFTPKQNDKIHVRMIIS